MTDAALVDRLADLLHEHDPMCSHDTCEKTARKIAPRLAELVRQPADERNAMRLVQYTPGSRRSTDMSGRHSLVLGSFLPNGYVRTVRRLQ